MNICANKYYIKFILWFASHGHQRYEGQKSIYIKKVFGRRRNIEYGITYTLETILLAMN